MSEAAVAGVERALAALHRFARQSPAAVLEKCELCAEPIPGEHPHLLELSSRTLCCVCRGCAVLFDRQAASEGRYRRVPDRRLRLDGFRLTESQWAGAARFRPRCGSDGRAARLS